jgi:hypothetical protein
MHRVINVSNRLPVTVGDNGDLSRFDGGFVSACVARLTALGK